MTVRTVASYCTTFLKPEMLHIYRQVAGLKRYRTVVLTLHRESEQRYPFADIEVIPPARINLIRRMYLKYIDRKPPIVYRGEYDLLKGILERRGAGLMHIYFGHTGVHLLPFVEAWPRPCIVSFHGMDVRDRAEHPGYLVKLKKLLQTVPLVLARSNSLAARLRELDCPPDKIRINRTGIPLNAFPFVERTPPIDGGWKIVQACRLVEKKGLPHTVNAFARFSKKFPNASLTIAGEGPLLSKLEDLAQSLGVRERIHFTGFLNQNQLFDLYSSSHIFMHPSHCVMGHDQEGIPNSMLEAMATGLPVVATFHGGIPEAITNKESGLLVEEKDVDGLTRALVDLASQPDLAEAIGKCGSQVVHSEFEHAAQVEKLETFYDEAWTHGR